MSKDITLLEEIAEQDLGQVNGGTSQPLVDPFIYSAVSRAFGNQGRICTGTIECQTNCSK